MRPKLQQMKQRAMAAWFSTFLLKAVVTRVNRRIGIRIVRWSVERCLRPATRHRLDLAIQAHHVGHLARLTGFLARWANQLDPHDSALGVEVRDQYLAPRGLVREFAAVIWLPVHEAKVADLFVNCDLLAFAWHCFTPASSFDRRSFS
jgi:hypothetical protein